MRQEGTPLSFCLITPFCKKSIMVFPSQTDHPYNFLPCQLGAQGLWNGFCSYQPHLQVWGCSV